MTDHVVCSLVVDSYDRLTLFFDVIPGDTMHAALGMLLPYTREVVGSYAILCARLAMLLKHGLAEGVDTRVRAYRDFNRRHTGVSWPLPVCVHPVTKMRALDVFVMTVNEFLPATT